MTTSTTTSAVPGYRLDISISEPRDPVILQGRACYRMVATVEAAFNMPAEVFVHQVGLPIGTDNRVIETFIGVAGPYDLVSMSDTTPDEKQMVRRNCVSMLLTSPQLAEEFIKTIRDGCQELVDSLVRLENLEVTQNLTISSQ